MSTVGTSDFDRAQMAAARGNHTLALELYRKALKLEPRRATIWWHMSLTMLNLSMFAEAKEAQEAAASLDPKIGEIYGLNLKLSEIKQLRTKGPASLPALLALAKDSDIVVCGSALRALESEAYKADASCVEPLVEALKTAVSTVDAKVYLAVLERIGAPAVEPTLRLLSEPAELPRHKAIELLAKLGDARAVPHLRSLLQHESESTRTRAAEALAKLEAEGGTPH